MSTKKPNVQFIRPEVQDMTARWETIRDCLEGEPAVKASDLATAAEVEADRYLPKPNATDTTVQNAARYEAYIARAVFYPVTQHTHAGMVGQVFTKEPVLEVPALLDTLLEDVDGSGVKLVQQAQKALGLALGYGRAGLLTDYPATDVPASRAEMEAGDIRPTIVLYQPWQIINWRTIKRGAKRVLSLVVLTEKHATSDDGFEEEEVDQYRVLSLEESGIYRVGVWRVADAKAGEFVEVEAFNPKDSRGNNLREIPFQFVGAINNDPDVDLPPLYDLAGLNVAHYRNSADYEESCFQVGQPTPWAAGLTQAWVDKNFATGIRLGSRAFLPLPAGGQCGLLQAEPNGMPFEAMQAKERQMVALGARLVEQRTVQRTLGEARLEYATELSVLGSCARNVADAYVKALTWAGQFAGVDGAAKFELDPDSELRRMTPEELRERVAAWQAKAISDTELRDALKRGGVATQEDEEWKAEVESKIDFGVPAVAPGGAAAARSATGQPNTANDNQNASADEESATA
jgi:hypothetical protein